MNCPKCNFSIPDTMLPYRPAGQATILKKKKLVFEIGEGDNKKTFTVIEPTNAKRDEYIELSTRAAQQQVEKQEAIKAINNRIADFSFNESGESIERTSTEIAEFKADMDEAMELVNNMPTPSNREAIEFFLGKIDDDTWYENEMVPSIVDQILQQCEDELCNLESVRKNMENLLPRTMLISSNALRKR